jgi:hypothetical protein
MKFETICAIMVTVIGCRAPDALAPLTSAQLCARKDSMLAQVRGRTIDDEFEMLAHLLPGGFGGLTSDYVFLKRLELADTARATAKALLQCPGESVGYLAYIQSTPPRQGDYDWIELRGWYSLLLAGAPAGITTADMDERINRLSFGFASDAYLTAFRTRAQALGVPLTALSLSVRPWAVPAGVAAT